MAGRSHRRLRRLPVLVAAVAGLVLLQTTVGTAQLPPIGATPTPAPSTEPEPTPAPEEPTPGPSDDPLPSDVPLPSDEVPDPTQTDEPTATPKKTNTPKDDLDDVLDEATEGFDLVIPAFPRTRARNTVKLVRLLRPLAKELGVPLEQVLIQGMGRFPVAGLANYFDDWANPRFTPEPHLHEGLDIFADFGTPVRAPVDGVITDMPTHGAGGTAIWMRDRKGTSFYFAHLLEWASDLEVGQRVETGTVIGYVGDTGNAQGGTPHLHFEIHPGGSSNPAVPPKPTVDAWLDEAEDLAPEWVAAWRADIGAKRRAFSSTNIAGGGRDDKETEASMLLTLLDPVGGSVGLLPTLEVGPRRGSGVSDRLFSELVRTRIEGGLFVESGTHHVHD